MIKELKEFIPPNITVEYNKDLNIIDIHSIPNSNKKDKNDISLCDIELEISANKDSYNFKDCSTNRMIINITKEKVIELVKEIICVE